MWKKATANQEEFFKINYSEKKAKHYLGNLNKICY